MSITIFDQPDVQQFLKRLSGLENTGGDPRTKQIIHRLMSDLFKAIDDLDITPDEYWAGIAWFNELGAAGQAGLISPGLGLDHFLDLRMDALDAARGIENETPRTIEGPLYVAGAPVEQGFARLDDGRDTDGQRLIMHGTVFGADGQPVPGASVEVWHCDTRGFYSTSIRPASRHPSTCAARSSPTPRAVTASRASCPKATACRRAARPRSCCSRWGATASDRRTSTSSLVQMTTAS